ncbi:MBL fold metallo-hydrolase [Nocardioides sp. WS12]|uniref:MBL fold metallo-hydrolase n=1 Tax=Nocardioides sp. WS12 TaxID=2486272 RepID=UPI0015FC5527|nr:MBL fold metallo-hydrolase [Nocardioides sp. WS12]
MTLTRITDRVTLIQLPLPLEGLTSVNCYVLRGDSEAVLVDPGWSSPETERALLDGLGELGLGPADIGRVLTTHHHWDHYTQAITWQGKHGIPVHLGRGDAPSIEAWHSLDGAFPRQVGLLRRAGAHGLAAEVEAMPAEVHEQDMDFDLPAGWIDDGAEIDLGGLVVRAHATPGHTRGHVCFEVVGEDLLLSGDHVLPRITPSIAYEREPSEDSLTSYLGSLRLVADLPGARLLPAHGAIGDSAAQRAKELIAHHDERLDVIRSLVVSGHATAHDIAAAMTWTRRERRLDDLDLVHRMTAVLEVAAHLTVLTHDGIVARTTDEGVAQYAAM